MAGNTLPSTTRTRFTAYSAAFALAIVLRLVLAYLIYGYSFDMGCFIGWMDELTRYSFNMFYESSAFCDYPPGYLYVLYLLSFIPFAAKSFIVKLPAILCDTLGAYFINRKTHSRAAALLYLLMPSVIADSSVWGQMDSVCALFVLLSLFALSEEKYIKSAVLFGIGAAMKMQTLMFAPIFLIVIIFSAYKNHALIKKALLSIMAAAVTIYAFAIPFFGFNPLDILSRYVSTMGSYKLATFNAFNLFALFCANGADSGGKFLFFSYEIWGYIAVALMFVFCTVLYFRAQKRESVVFLAALFLLGVFTCSSMMHERYLFCAQILFFAAWGQTRSAKVLASALLCAVSQSINIIAVFLFSLQGITVLPADSKILIIGSFITLAALAFAIYTYIDFYIAPVSISPLPEAKDKRITGADALLLCLFIFAASALSFYNLGNTDAPSTPALGQSEAQLASHEISAVVFFSALGEEPFDVYLGSEKLTLTPRQCFAWTRASLDTPISAQTAAVINADHILEVAFTNRNGELMELTGSGGAFDEQQHAPQYINFLNSTYFDEIYYARTAYEYNNNLPIYETTHPPLGKLIIALSMRIFGDTPFGWRFPSALCGVLLVALIYIFAKKLFGTVYAAFLASFLTLCDFCRISLSRIATLDSISLLFIVASLYFLYCYITEKKFSSITLCALFLGAACAVKWTGFYIVPMAVVFFARSHPPRRLWFCPLIAAGVYAAAHIGSGEFWQYQLNMLSYHGTLTAAHPYASAWAQWPLVAVPVFTELGEPNTRMAILGCIFLWWPLLPTAFIMARVKDIRIRFLLTAALSLYLPWVFIGRVTFIYHFAAPLIFFILILVYALQYLKKPLVLTYCAVCSAMCALFSPLLLGLGGNVEILKWFEKWIF
ncbi:MAG: glycosyltransferase family 39 protein [Clostridia bacterium]|nr:glycosyltransferase family 39 protein [Clostridia bacterium]